MTRSATRGSFLLLSGLLLGVAPMACSTDGRGLGVLDAGGASGGRIGAGSGGGVVAGSGGMTTSDSGGAVGTGTGGATGSGGATASGGSGTGGALGTGGSSTGGNGSAGTISTGGTVVGGRGGRGGVGGMASGGRVGTGGAATGGASTGGRVGSGGAGTGGHVSTGGAFGSQSECTRDTDCHLVDDCCTCAAFGSRQEPPLCGLLCVQSKCDAQRLPPNAVACVAGRCVAGFNCDDSTVTCKMAPPVCADGQVPGVNAEGTCYVGGCVPATQCTSVADCRVCSTSEACVTNQSRGRNEHHCVTLPTSCNSASCSCLGDSVCVSPYTTCENTSGGVKGVTCGCPTC